MKTTTFYVCRDATGYPAVCREGNQTDDVITTTTDFDEAMGIVADLRHPRAVLAPKPEETKP